MQIKLTIFFAAILALLGFVIINPFSKAFLYIPALMLITIIPTLIMGSIHGKKAFSIYKAKGFVKNNIIDQWHRIILSTAIIISLIGVTQIAANLNDIRNIGQPLALALSALLYAFCIKLFLLEPFRDTEVSR